MDQSKSPRLRLVVRVVRCWRGTLSYVSEVCLQMPHSLMLLHGNLASSYTLIDHCSCLLQCSAKNSATPYPHNTTCKHTNPPLAPAKTNHSTLHHPSLKAALLKGTRPHSTSPHPTPPHDTPPHPTPALNITLCFSGMTLLAP